MRWSTGQLLFFVFASLVVGIVLGGAINSLIVECSTSAGYDCSYYEVDLSPAKIVMNYAPDMDSMLVYDPRTDKLALVKVYYHIGGLPGGAPDSIITSFP